MHSSCASRSGLHPMCVFDNIIITAILFDHSAGFRDRKNEKKTSIDSACATVYSNGFMMFLTSAPLPSLDTCVTMLIDVTFSAPPLASRVSFRSPT